MIEGETDKERTLRSSKGYKGWDWDRPEPGARNSHLGDRGPVTWTIFCHFPRHISRGLAQKRSSWQLHQHMWCHIPRGRLSCCATKTVRTLKLKWFTHEPSSNLYLFSHSGGKELEQNIKAKSLTFFNYLAEVKNTTFGLRTKQTHL